MWRDRFNIIDDGQQIIWEAIEKKNNWSLCVFSECIGYDAIRFIRQLAIDN